MKRFCNATMRHLLPLVIVFSLLVSCTRKPSVGTNLITDLDTTVRAQDDFFQYACGDWIAKHPMPENKSKYDVSVELADMVDEQIHDIINDLLSKKQKPGSINEKILQFYKSGMDTAAINAAGIEPIRYILDIFDSMQNTADLQHCISMMQQFYLKAPFSIQYGPYLSNSSVFAFVIGTDGISLEDSELYFEDDEYSKNIIKSYKAHIEKIFLLLGEDSATARQSAKATYNIEYQIANISLDQTTSHNISQVVHNNSIDDLTTKMPTIDWQLYFNQLGVPIPDTIVIDADDMYLPRLDTILRQTPIDDWKAYFKYEFIDCISFTLDSNFVNERFNFKKRILTGQEENDPRWKQVLNEVELNFDDAIAKMYVEKHFPPEAKKRALEITNNLKAALTERIAKVSWMCDSTRTKALDKVAKTRIKVGYPDSWMDYSQYNMCDTYATNLLTCMSHYFKYEMSFINKNVGHDLWYEILPFEVNLYTIYNLNEIVIPAAILQPPFFFANGDDAINYGAMGAAIGHELTHGFDTQGRMYDSSGNLKDWWSDYDKTEFDHQAQKLIDLFNSFVIIDTLHANGEFTLCENIADLGGLVVAYTAFSKTEQWKDQTKLIDGLTPDQRFFIAYAQTWAGIIRDEAIRQQTKTNHHSLYRYRVEGILPNLDAFEKAFDIKPGDKYYLPDSLKTYIW